MYLKTQQMLKDLHLFLVKMRRTGYTQMLIRLAEREKICIIFRTQEEMQDQINARWPDSQHRSALSLGQLGKQGGSREYPTFLDNATIMEVADRAICAVDEVVEKWEKSQKEVKQLKLELAMSQVATGILRGQLKVGHTALMTELEHSFKLQEEVDALRNEVYALNASNN